MLQRIIIKFSSFHGLLGLFYIIPVALEEACVQISISEITDPFSSSTPRWTVSIVVANFPTRSVRLLSLSSISKTSAEIGGISIMKIN